MSDTPRTQKARGFHDLETAVAAKEMEKLERELNAAKAALSGRTVSCSNCNAMAEENVELKNAADIICAREADLVAKFCRAKDEITAMKKLIREIYNDTEGYADGAPDASGHDKLCNEISSKLQPYLK